MKSPRHTNVDYCVIIKTVEGHTVGQTAFQAGLLYVRKYYN